METTMISSACAEANSEDYFDLESAYAWADQIVAVFPQFDSERFVRLAGRGLSSLKLEQRVQRFARALRETLPGDVPTALALLVESLPEPYEPCDIPDDAWLQWPMSEFIALYGLDFLEDSMDAMAALTEVLGAEFALRPFLEQRPQESFEYLYARTGDPCPQVRRWCSEGTRPRLPKAKILASLVKDPTPIWPILEALKDDPDPCVRRSVADNLHDISRDHPDLVAEKAQDWLAEAGEERRWIVRHALRSLVQSGHPKALAIQGFFPPPEELVVELLVSPRTLVIGESVKLTARLHNQGDQELALQVDFVLHFTESQRARSGTVFKCKPLRLAPSARVALSKVYPMLEKGNRTLQCGRYTVEAQVNGVKVGQAGFTLL